MKTIALIFTLMLMMGCTQNGMEVYTKKSGEEFTIMKAGYQSIQNESVVKEIGKGAIYVKLEGVAVGESEVYFDNGKKTTVLVKIE